MHTNKYLIDKHPIFRSKADIKYIATQLHVSAHYITIFRTSSGGSVVDRTSCSYVAIKVNSCVRREVLVFVYKHLMYDYPSIAVDEYHDVTVYSLKCATIGEELLLKVKETLAALELNCKKTEKCANCWWQKYVQLLYWVEYASKHGEELH